MGWKGWHLPLQIKISARLWLILTTFNIFYIIQNYESFITIYVLSYSENVLFTIKLTINTRLKWTESREKSTNNYVMILNFREILSHNCNIPFSCFSFGSLLNPDQSEWKTIGCECLKEHISYDYCPLFIQIRLHGFSR